MGRRVLGRIAWKTPPLMGCRSLGQPAGPWLQVPQLREGLFIGVDSLVRVRFDPMMLSRSGRYHQVLCCLLALALIMVDAAQEALGESPDPKIHLGSWIWAAETYDRQECRLVRSFEIPAGASVRWARMLITADNFYELYFDGQAIGRGGDWRTFIEYDLKQLLTPGEHVLAVDAFNDFDVAGMICGLRVELEDGRVIEILSDNSWKLAPNTPVTWKEKTRAWGEWPEATALPNFSDPIPRLVYSAPALQPMEISLWQRRWFQGLCSSAMLVSVLVGLFLGSQLILQSQMEQVVRRERARIALDLHDGLGGEITKLVLFGETSRRSFLADSQEASLLAAFSDKSRGLLREMNETVWLINSQRDTCRDLASYVVKYAEGFFQNSPIRCRFDIEQDLPPLPCNLGIRRNLFLAVKEALNNVLRHSQATHAEISIHLRKNELFIAIRDNGRGFSPEVQTGGNGLGSMALRAAEFGGEVRLGSAPGQGCAVEFYVPLRAAQQMKVGGLIRWMRSKPKGQAQSG